VTNANGHVSPLAPLVDETRMGSKGGQALIGVAGIVLALILVMGQISLATTKGISTHLHASVLHMTEGNKVMESVVERAAPSTELEKVLAAQAITLAHTKDAMVGINGEMTTIGKTTDQLGGVVGGMEKTSGGLATGVAGMDRDTARIDTMLGTLPAATDRTGVALGTINTDTKALNAELAAISAKMRRYGLPAAMGAPR